MSRTRSCVGILFIISMIIGILLGYMVLEGMEVPPPPITIDPNIIPTKQQQNFQSILVVGVDSLMNPAPSLEGAWQITLEQSNGQSNGSYNFDISTLYPVTKATILSTRHGKFAEAHPNIIVDPDNITALTELEPISYYQGEWTDIIVVDEIVINMLVSLQNPNTPKPIPTPHPSLFIKPWKDPEGAFQQQRAILTTLCDHPDPLSEPAVVLEILQMYGQHLTSTMSSDGLLDLWQVMNYTSDTKIDCSFYP